MMNRGTSTTLGYVLTLSIATLLVGGLIVAGSTFVEDRREQVIRQELTVMGQHITASIDQVDRYARASDDLEVAHIQQTFPTDVTGSTYDIRLVDGSDDATLFLNTTQPEVSVRINVTTVTPISTTTFVGGETVRVACEVSGGDCDRIVIENV
jgi:hypothetical protein